jgi:hypothetical protein
MTAARDCRFPPIHKRRHSLTILRELGCRLTPQEGPFTPAFGGREIVPSHHAYVP